MPSPLRKEYEYYHNDQPDYGFRSAVPKKIKRKKIKRNKVKILPFLLGVTILSFYSYYICPYNFQKYFEPLFLNRFLNRNIKLDLKPYVSPTLSYLHNSFIVDDYVLSPISDKSKEIADIQILNELTDTKNKLLNLFKNYSNLKPSVFVWEYSTNSGFEINSDEIYPSASIIKIPIAFELMRLVDSSQNTSNPINLTDKREFKEEYRTLGSGDLQYTSANVKYSLDHLANIMIANSDNSATNMILYEIGGVDGFNRAMRNLGLDVTSMGQWLPDLEGENKTTAREIAKILYNIDNPNYINPKYKNILKEYLGNTRNIHLIKEKLPSSAMVLHKTGNIATMLGDAGVVYTDKNKKYIVSILVKRPENDYGAKTLIQEASKIIYDDINEI